MNVELTPDEIKVICNISMRAGCDRDGDILAFFVKEDKNIAIVTRSARFI